MIMTPTTHHATSRTQLASQRGIANSITKCDRGDREVEEYLMRGFEAGVGCARRTRIRVRGYTMTCEFVHSRVRVAHPTFTNTRGYGNRASASPEKVARCYAD